MSEDLPPAVSNAGTNIRGGDARLPRLEDVVGISEHAVAALTKARVTLVQHLLALPAADLARRTGLSQVDLRTCFIAVHVAFVPRVRVAADEVTSTGGPSQSAHLRSTLSAATVFSLTGALESDLVDIIGPSGSGKTQLCLTAAAAVAASGRSVILFDTSAALSVCRIVDMLEACHASAADVDACLRRIVHVPVATVGEAETALQRLADDVRLASVTPPTTLTLRLSTRVCSAVEVDMQAVLSSVGLIVFDSIAALLAPVLGRKWSDGWTGFACSNVLARHLRQLADLTKATVLITNRQVKLEGRGDDLQRGALGRSWSHVSNVKVFLKELEECDYFSNDVPSEPRITLRCASSRSPPIDVKIARITRAGVTLQPG
jgi:RAD51-like protein 3